jgi:hypothetical protein
MARGSAYGDMIKMPSWVFGGEFGDISNLLNKRDQAYEETENAEITNDRNQIRLEEEQRKVDINEEMRKRGVFGDSGDQPVTLRDMYEKRRDIATELGSYEDVVEMEKQLENIKREQEKQEREKIIQERQDEEYNYRKQRRGAGGSDDSGKPEKSIDVYNPETDDLRKIPISQLDNAKRVGYVERNHPRLAEMIEEAQAKKNAPPAKKSSGFFTPWGDEAPAPAPSPSPVPGSRGDTARQTPAPGDQVKLIVRNRASAVRGQ